MGDTEKIGAKATSPNNPKTNELGTFGKIAVIVILLLFVWLVVKACSFESKRVVHAKEYGTAWPFAFHETVDVACPLGVYNGVWAPIALVKVGEDIYGLNALAVAESVYGEKVPDARQFIPKDKNGRRDPQMLATIEDLTKRAIAYECGGSSTLIGKAADRCFFYTDGQDTPCTPAYRDFKERADNRKKLYGQ